MNLSLLLWGIPQAMRAAARLYPEYAARLNERNLIAQFRLRDKPEGRWIKLENGKVTLGQRSSCQARISRSTSRTRRSRKAS